jgi:hypothetical protein
MLRKIALRIAMMMTGVALTLPGVQCGGSSPTAPPVTQPTPTPAPAPTPTPKPVPTPPPNCSPGGDCPGNMTPVARAILRPYALLDPNGNLVYPPPGHDHGIVTPNIPLNYTLRLDLTGRDKDGYETNGIDGTGAGIIWYYSDINMVEEGMLSAWQRKLRVLKTGTFKVFVVFDGIGSNDLTCTFVP